VDNTYRLRFFLSFRPPNPVIHPMSSCWPQVRPQTQTDKFWVTQSSSARCRLEAALCTSATPPTSMAICLPTPSSMFSVRKRERLLRAAASTSEKLQNLRERVNMKYVLNGYQICLTGGKKREKFLKTKAVLFKFRSSFQSELSSKTNFKLSETMIYSIWN